MLPLRLLSHLPLSVLHALGAALGWLIYLASPTYRRHLRRNLAFAVGEDAARRLLPAAVAHAGRGVMELPRVWLRPPAEVLTLMRDVRGWEVVEEAERRGRGIVFLTPHLGCFEISALYYAAQGPITVLYRPAKLAWVERLIGQGRASLKLAPADFGGVRRLIAALKRNEAVGLLPDQVPGRGEGTWLPFFGRPAYTMTLAARLADTEATVILAFAERLPRGAGFVLHLQKLELAGDTLEARATDLNAALERLILTRPEQYLWGYNRYKRPAGAPPPPESAS